ncbi:hypothetical protein B7760_04481 [Burkholderia glumae]|nr:hypothetical protein B7760_04481 [Burkholderia glumae]
MLRTGQCHALPRKCSGLCKRMRAGVFGVLLR